MKKTISLTTPLTLTNLHKAGEVWVNRVLELKKAFDSAVGGRKERIGKVWLEMFWRSTTLATMLLHQTHQLPPTISKNERVRELLEGEGNVFEKSQQLRLLTTLTPKPFKKGGVVSKSVGVMGPIPFMTKGETIIDKSISNRFTPPTPPTNPPTSKDVGRGDKE